MLSINPNRKSRRRLFVAATIAAASSVLLSAVSSAWTFDEIDVAVIGDPDKIVGTPYENAPVSFAATPTDVVTDAAGNIYTAGFFDRPIDVDPSSGEDVREPARTASDEYGSTYYVAKFDANGDFVWFNQLPYLLIRQLALSPDGERLWLAGDTLTNLYGDNFGSPAGTDFDTGTGDATIAAGRRVAAAYTTEFEFESVTAIVSPNPNESTGGFAVDSGGNPTLLTMFGNGSNVERIRAGASLVTEGPLTSSNGSQLVKLDGDDTTADFGSVVWTAEADFGGLPRSLDVGPDDDLITLTRSADNMTVSRFAADGTPEWSTSFTISGNNDMLGNVVVDDDDNVVAVASISSIVDFGVASIGPEGERPSASVLLRFDPTGAVISAVPIPGAILSGGYYRRITRTDDAIYITAVTGQYDWVSQSETYSQGALAKYDLAGELVWIKPYSQFGFAQVMGIAPDRSVGVVRVGWIYGTLPIDGCGTPGSPDDSLTAINYVLRTDEHGAFGRVEAASFSATSLTELAVGGDNWVPVRVSCPTSAVWTITEGTLPEGLVLDQATGVISGEPTETGPYSFEITVTNALGSQSQTFTGDVTAGTAPTWPADTAQLGTLTKYEPYDTTLFANGGPAPLYSVTAGRLPIGLELNPRTGELTGAPVQDGPYSFTVTATNAFGSSDFTFAGDVSFGDPGSTSTTTVPGGSASTTVPGGSASTTVPGGSASTTVPSGTLPSTGSDLLPVTIAVLLAALGATLSLVSRRRAH